MEQAEGWWLMGVDKGDLGRTLRHLNAGAVAFSAAGMASTMKVIGDAAAKDADAAVVGTIGDLSMSHWSRRRPVPITSRAVVAHSGSSVTVSPGRATGQMRVLESGRQGGE